ncbi:MAG: PQQ-binding-like beta-propeller repeat protein [Planctomycetales bacterium]|nr:PQQ-binding-like beta-propeller repeat protein [Planctomycetales bacterium]
MSDRRFVHAILAIVYVVFLARLLESPSVADDWPRFRGPNGDGKTSDTSLPVEWGDEKNLKWKLKLPGAGFSSPIVVGDTVFVTAYSGSGNNVKRHVISVDREKGSINWTKSTDGVSDGGEPGFAYHGQASHTPVCDGERLYAMLGSSGIKAYDLAGNELWHHDLGNERSARFGTASSPILYGDLLIVTAGSESESIRAFNKVTGEEVWKAQAGSLSQSYSTPLLVTASDGVEHLVHSVAFELWGMNPKTGKLIWYAETKVDTAACPSVLADNDIVYVIGGRSGGRAAIKLGSQEDVASGKDITAKNTVWSESGGSYVPSPVLYEEKLYWINDQGVGMCVDTKTGEEVARKRIGGRYYASVLLAGDKLYAVSRFDGTRVFKISPEFQEIAHNTLSDESDFSASPAASNGQLFIRSDEALYCIAQE